MQPAKGIARFWPFAFAISSMKHAIQAINKWSSSFSVSYNLMLYKQTLEYEWGPLIGN